MYRDGNSISIWESEVHSIAETKFKTQKYDVVIAGGGITGFSCALTLQQSGKKCLLLEAENIGFGSTGGTSAHLNTYFDAPFYKVIKDFGLEKAKLYSQTGKEAIEIIKSNIKEFDISCQFEDKTAYLFATEEKQVKELDKIVSGCNKVGIKMLNCEHIPFPVPFIKAAKIEGQGQFHPIRYVNGLKEAFLALGGEYLEKCRVGKYSKEGKSLKISTSLGTVDSKYLIYATHIPPGVNLLHFRNIPWRSYVLGIEMPHISLPQSLGYDLNHPYHYFRFQQVDGMSYLIAGGKDHKTGEEVDAKDSLIQLEQHVRQFFNVKKIAFAWSSQYYESVDGLPFIGKIPGGPDEVMVATGFSGNGMIFGTIAGKMLTDLIETGESEYEDLLNPSRIKFLVGFKKCFIHNIKSVSNLAKSRIISSGVKDINEIGSNEGKIIKINGKTYAVSKDAAGEINVLENRCSHLHCIVNWNNLEHSWDCPCHGSRFGIKGNILNAPAERPLTLINTINH